MTTEHFPTEDIRFLAEHGEDGVASSDGLLRIADEYVGDWRWGTRRRLIFQRNLEGATKWAFEYRVSSGDGEWSEWDDAGDTVEVRSARAVPHTTIEWVLE